MIIITTPLERTYQHQVAHFCGFYHDIGRLLQQIAADGNGWAVGGGKGEDIVNGRQFSTHKSIGGGKWLSLFMFLCQEEIQREVSECVKL